MNNDNCTSTIAGFDGQMVQCDIPVELTHGWRDMPHEHAYYDGRTIWWTDHVKADQ